MRIDYGIDAPGVIRNLALGGVAGIALGSVGAAMRRDHPLSRIQVASWAVGVSLLVASALLILYSRFGKFRHRDRILAMLPLRGDERVLDIGTGRGLLAVAAAKRLTTGRVVGFDNWNADDLSNNSRARTEQVLAAEGVADRVDLEDGDAVKLPFADESFDAVVSNLCIHNIYNEPGRRNAIREVGRVLRPGGRVVISDYKHTSDYARYFRADGLISVEVRGPYLIDVFPPLRIVLAVKAHAS